MVDLEQWDWSEDDVPQSVSSKKINTRNGIAEVTAFWIDERHDQQQNCRQKVMTTHSKDGIGNRLDDPEVQGSLTAL